MRWTILWHTREGCAADAWNIAHADTEAGACDRARHFLKLGFPVYAIRSAAGSVFMDRAQLVERFGPNSTAPAQNTDATPKMASSDGAVALPATDPLPLSAHTSGSRL